MNKKNLPKSALTEVYKLYEGAKRERNEAQWIKAVIYINHLEENKDLSISVRIKQLQDEILSAPSRVAAVLKSFEAEQLFQYSQLHRYEHNDETDIEKRHIPK